MADSKDERKIVETFSKLSIHGDKLSRVLQQINHLKLSDGSCENTVYYTNLCKLAARLCHENNLHSDKLYYLSECHAAALRQMCRRRQELFSDRCQSSFNDEHTSFQSSYANNKFEGLCRRIEELPKEWTLVQITQQFHTGEGWELRKPNDVVDETGLHIVRYDCGTRQKPIHVYIPPMNTEYVSGSILDVIHTCLLNGFSRGNRNKVNNIRNSRENSCSQLNEVIRDIARKWLEEWRCLLLGKFCDTEMANVIKNTVENVLRERRIEIAECDKLLILQIASGSGILCHLDIENALSHLIEDTDARSCLLEAIKKIKSRFENELYYAKRYPVIFLIDEKLQRVPWEETPGLRNQPMSRLPSVHFVHAFYKMHENKIVNGNIVLGRDVSGYYFVNPDQTLGRTEKFMIDFLERRLPNWQGTVGETSSKEEVTDALINHDIFLYCGHGTGVQYMKTSHLFTLNAKAIPLMFGCGSVEYKDQGGRVPFASYANSYLIAGSPCVLGMLWPVTSTDVDNMTVALLNYWLPGKPVVIDGMEKFNEGHIHSARTEPELLRAIRFARDVAAFSFNKSAMVVYGLPVIFG